MKLLKFKQPWSVYNDGETAGFAEDTAAKLIAAGIAVEAGDDAASGAGTDAAEPVAPKVAAAKADVKAAAAENLPKQGAEGG